MEKCTTICPNSHLSYPAVFVCRFSECYHSLWHRIHFGHPLRIVFLAKGKHPWFGINGGKSKVIVWQPFACDTLL